jgi:hypothetical protein
MAEFSPRINFKEPSIYLFNFWSIKKGISFKKYDTK